MKKGDAVVVSRVWLDEMMNPHGVNVVRYRALPGAVVFNLRPRPSPPQRPPPADRHHVRGWDVMPVVALRDLIEKTGEKRVVAGMEFTDATEVCMTVRERDPRIAVFALLDAVLWLLAAFAPGLEDGSAYSVLLIAVALLLGVTIARQRW